MLTYTPKFLKPVHLHAIRLYAQGMQINEIADMLDYTTVQIGNILRSPQAVQILEALHQEAFDSMSQVQQDAQLIAPVLFEELIKEALTADRPDIRHRAKVVALGIAGHSTTNITINKRSVTDDLNAKSDKELMDYLNGKNSNQPNGLGPDGKPLQ
jgi:hypothetical protein